MALSKSEIKDLKGQAHHLKAILQIGKDGITDAVATSVSDALSARELIKVKFLENSEIETKVGGVDLAEKVGAELVGTIGFVAILYKHSENCKRHVLNAE